jgi:acyl carrier protein
MDLSLNIKEFVVEEFAPDITVDELDSDFDLLEHGIIDSLGLLMMLAWVEEHFDVSVDVAEVEQHDFRSVDAICALIERSTVSPASS